MKNIKRYLERQVLGGMVADGSINEETDLWLWHCVFDYFTYE